MAVCAVDGCENQPRRRGLCRKHEGGKTCARCDAAIGSGARSLCLDCYNAVRTVPRETWDLATAATDYRLRIAAAEAKVRQALAIRQHPDTVFPATVEECLYAALAELDVP